MRSSRLYRVGLLGSLLLLLLAVSAVAHASSADAVWPEPAGTDVKANGKLVIDASHMDQGYVMCRDRKSVV